MEDVTKFRTKKIAPLSLPLSKGEGQEGYFFSKFSMEDVGKNLEKNSLPVPPSIKGGGTGGLFFLFQILSHPPWRTWKKKVAPSPLTMHP